MEEEEEEEKSKLIDFRSNVDFKIATNFLSKEWEDKLGQKEIFSGSNSMWGVVTMCLSRTKNFFCFVVDRSFPPKKTCFRAISRQELILNAEMANKEQDGIQNTDAKKAIISSQSSKLYMQSVRRSCVCNE